MLEAGIVGDQVRKISRHSKETEIFHTNYVRVGVQTAQRVAGALDNLLATQYNGKNGSVPTVATATKTDDDRTAPGASQRRQAA